MASGSSAYVFCALALAGEGVLLWGLVGHRSLIPVILGRYSARYAALLGLMSFVFLSTGAFVLARWRHLPSYRARLSSLGPGASAALGSLLALGALGVLCAASFASVVAWIIPAPALIAGAALLYVGCAGLVLGSGTHDRSPRIRDIFMLMLGGLCVGLAIAEVGLRAYSGFMQYRILPPNLRRVFHPQPEVMPGVSGPAWYTTDEHGVRGDPYQATGRYNILAVGGSTTENVYLDDTESWHHLLQTRLNARGHTPPVWVGNVGRSGHGLVEHIHAIRHFVPQLRLDAVVVLAGVNDLVPVWWEPSRYDASAEDPEDYVQFFHKSFHVRPLVDPAVSRPFPESLALWNLGELTFWRLLNLTETWRVQDTLGINYDERRRILRNAPVLLDEVPGLAAAVERYELNLRTLIRAAGDQGVRLLLMTQPVIWSDHLSEDAKQRLWLGMRIPDGRYEPHALLEAMNRFNQKLLDVSRETGTEYVDLASSMNGMEAYYYDEVHFTELGARVVADLLADYLIATR